VNWLDVALVLTICISVLAGFVEGFVKTGVRFLASLLGLVLGLIYYHPLGLWLRGMISRAAVANIVAFLIIYLFVTVAGSVITQVLVKFVRATDLTWLDRALGGAFGVVRGLTFATVIVWALLAFVPLPPHMLFDGSRVAPRVMEAARLVADASPAEVRQSFRQSYRELNKVLPDKIKDRIPSMPTGQI